MRPVDLLPNAAHAFFDQTFDNNTGNPLLVIKDFAWPASAAAAATVAANPNSAYTYFRNATTWGAPPRMTPGLKPAPVMFPLPATGRTIRFFVANTATPRVMASLDRDGIANLQISSQFLSIQIDTPAMRSLRIRVAVPPLEATDLARVNQEAGWNALPPAPTPALVMTQLTKRMTKTGTVPNDPDPPGTYYGYAGSKTDLVATLGHYCSYCEMRACDDLFFPVEHRLAKASYPSDILRWDNFLFACRACNTGFKGESPNRIDGITRAIALFYPGNAFAGPITNNAAVLAAGGVLPYHQMVQACNRSYVWPSLNDGWLDPNNAAPQVALPTNYSLRCYDYQMYQVNPDGSRGAMVNANRAQDLRNRAVEDSVNRKGVDADIWDPATQQLVRMPVRVEALPRPLGLGIAVDGPKLMATTRTADMVGLNSFAKAVGDRRQLQRTYAWFDALETLGKLLDARAKVNSLMRNNRLVNYFTGDPNTLYDAALLAAAQNAEKGYYSVWLTVFKRCGDAALASALANKLDARRNDRGPYRYRGSSLQNSVISQIPHL